MYHCPIEQMAESPIVRFGREFHQLANQTAVNRFRARRIAGAGVQIMLHNSRSKPDPLRGAEGAQVVTKVSAGDSSLTVSFVQNGHHQGETDTIMEALLREYHAPYLFPRT